MIILELHTFLSKNITSSQLINRHADKQSKLSDLHSALPPLPVSVVLEKLIVSSECVNMGKTRHGPQQQLLAIIGWGLYRVYTIQYIHLDI